MGFLYVFWLGSSFNVRSCREEPKDFPALASMSQSQCGSVVLCQCHCASRSFMQLRGAQSMGHVHMWITFHCNGTQVCVLSIDISKVRQDKDPSSGRTPKFE